MRTHVTVSTLANIILTMMLRKMKLMSVKMRQVMVNDGHCFLNMADAWFIYESSANSEEKQRFIYGELVVFIS